MNKHCVLCEVGTELLYSQFRWTMVFEAVSCRPFTAEDRFWTLVSPCRICGGQCSTGTGFSSNTSLCVVIVVLPLLRTRFLFSSSSSKQLLTGRPGEAWGGRDFQQMWGSLGNQGAPTKKSTVLLSVFRTLKKQMLSVHFTVLWTT
jgi:hypothetical protein